MKVYALETPVSSTPSCRFNVETFDAYARLISVPIVSTIYQLKLGIRRTSSTSTSRSQLCQR